MTLPVPPAVSRRQTVLSSPPPLPGGKTSPIPVRPVSEPMRPVSGAEFVAAEADEPAPFFDRLSVLATSFGVSTLLHLLVLMVMAFVLFRETVEMELLVESGIESKKPVQKLATIDSSLSAVAIRTERRQTTTTVALPVTRSGPTGSLSIDMPAPEVGNPDPGKGAGGKGNLFGTGREAKSFVFVVDCSASMTGSRFELAISELVRTINRLKTSQRFYVVFYSNETLPLFFSGESLNLAPAGNAGRRNTRRKAPVRRIGNRLVQGKQRPDRRRRRRLLPATPTYKRLARQWIQRIRPGGGTLPQEALEMALELKPEVIYFLTDGQIPFDTPEIIRAANRHGVRINTIALEYAGSASPLEQIAKENNGTYRFVE